MWSVLHSVLWWCGVAVGAAVLRSVLRCCDVEGRCCGVASVLRSMLRCCGPCCSQCCSVALGVAVSVGCCGVVVMCCDVAVKVVDAVFRSVVQWVQMS